MLTSQSDKGVEGVDRFVRRSTGLQMYEYLGLCSGYIVDFPYFYFPFVVCFQYRVDDDRCCLAIRYFGNGESPLISFFDFCTYFDRTAAFTVVVSGDIDEPTQFGNRDKG